MTIKGIANIENLGKRLQGEFGFTNGELRRAIDKSGETIAKKGARILRKTSPVRTGAYIKGWTASKVGPNWVIHNRTNYQLTHLLEKPHARKGGGPDVQPQVHIQPVEDMVINEYLNELERILRDG